MPKHSITITVEAPSIDDAKKITLAALNIAYAAIEKIGQQRFEKFSEKIVEKPQQIKMAANFVGV